MEYLVMSICLMSPVPVINAFFPQIFSVENGFLRLTAIIQKQ